MIETAQHDGRPLPEVMLRIVTGYWISQAVGAVARLGVPDQLADGPRSSDELARAVGAHPQALFRVLRTLASIGIFSQPDPGVFALTPLGETLRSDTPGSVRNFAIAQTAYGHWETWGRFVESVKTGEPMAREALGMELWQWYGAHPQDAAFFSAAMGNLAALAAGELVRVYDVTTARTIADVGGAHGVLLAAALQANPAAHGILFDLPQVIATAAPELEARGIADRVALVGGDFFAAVPEGADLHILKQIVHDWDDEHAARILTNCHRALAPGGKILLVEMVVPPDNHPSGAQPMDLNMLVMLGGRERTEAEFEGLLAGAGFRLEHVIPTRSPFSVIEATRV
ncbi:MAG: methyltransferase [Solirubrobacteraceae bacterium]